MSLEKRMDHLHWLQDVGGTFSSISGIACHSQCYNLLSPFGSGYEKTLFLLKKMMALIAAFGFVLVQDLVKECKQVHSPLLVFLRIHTLSNDTSASSQTILDSSSILC